LALLVVSVTSLEPGFVSPLENITVAAGRSAHFTCVVNHLGGHKVDKFIAVGLLTPCKKNFSSRGVETVGEF
jgi:hypothetical protein